MRTMAKPKKLSDDDIASLVSSSLTNTVGFNDSKLAQERERVARYYNGELPAPIHTGNSKYISADVYDSVESMKATLLETFSGNHQPIRFTPQNSDDVALAAEATDYTDYVVFRQNDGYSVFHDVIHDGLNARVGIAKVYWDKASEQIEESFEGMTQDEFMATAVDPAIIDFQDVVVDEDGTLSGTMIREKDTSQVRICPVPPEEFFISPRAKSTRDADVHGQRTRMTQSDLIKMGIPRKTVEDLAGNDQLWIEVEPEVQARHSATEGSGPVGYEIGTMKPDRRRIDVHEVYIHLDVDGEGVSRLWKVLWAGKTVLDKERVDRTPYITFVPLPVPHTFYGNNFAAKIIPTQNARTTLVRGILDHTVITNNPRYQVVRGGVLNPKELMENRTGGLVNVTRPDAILPLPQAGLNPFVFQTVQLLDEDKEESTGISKLSQGLNKDAISKQNSADMVNAMVTVSQQRQKIVARNFAQGFLKPLWLEVYRLVLEHEKEDRVIAVAGSFTKVSPSTWCYRSDVEIEFALGHNERDKESAKYTQVDMMLSQDPTLAGLYPIEKRYNTISRALKAGGIRDVDTFLLRPDQVPPPQPSPAEQMQMQMAMKELELREREVAIKEAELQLAAQRAAMDTRLKETKVTGELQLAASREQRELVKLDHNMVMDAKEMELAQRAEESKAVYSPNAI